MNDNSSDGEPTVELAAGASMAAPAIEPTTLQEQADPSTIRMMLLKKIAELEAEHASHSTEEELQAELLKEEEVCLYPLPCVITPVSLPLH